MKKRKVIGIVLKRTGAVKLLFSYLIIFAAVSVGIWIVEPAAPRFIDGLWYCYSVATTIGFGDITAVTVIGRILSVFLSICSILIIAIVPGIITSYYIESSKLRMNESAEKFLYDLEHLPELSADELKELSEKAKEFNKNK